MSQSEQVQTQMLAGGAAADPASQPSARPRRRAATAPDTALQSTASTKTRTGSRSRKQTTTAGETAPTDAPAPAEPKYPHVPMQWPEQEKYSEPWMVPWLEAAAASLSLLDACRAAGIGLAQYMMGRQNDLAFDRAAVIFDQIVDLIIEERIRQGALDGDPQMTKIYLEKIRKPAYAPNFATHTTRPKPRPIVEEALEPHVTEAMIAAGIEAMKHGPPPRDALDAEYL